MSSRIRWLLLTILFSISFLLGGVDSLYLELPPDSVEFFTNKTFLRSDITNLYLIDLYNCKVYRINDQILTEIALYPEKGGTWCEIDEEGNFIILYPGESVIRKYIYNGKEDTFEVKTYGLNPLVSEPVSIELLNDTYYLQDMKGYFYPIKDLFYYFHPVLQKKFRRIYLQIGAIDTTIRFDLSGNRIISFQGKDTTILKDNPGRIHILRFLPFRELWLITGKSGSEEILRIDLAQVTWSEVNLDCNDPFVEAHTTVFQNRVYLLQVLPDKRRMILIVN